MADLPSSSRTAALPLIAAVLLGGLFYIGGQWIQSENEPENATISVSGDGRVFVAPDIAEITVGIQTGRQTSAGTATEKLKAGMDKVIAAVKETGVEEKDIRTQNFWLNPVYDYTEGRQIPRGYEANQNLTIKVRDLDNVSRVLGAAVNAGANQAGSIQFTIDEPDAKREEARAQAIEEAKEKARVLAEQLGVELKDIVGFSEGYSGGVTPSMMTRSAYGMGGVEEDMAMAKEIQLPAGEQEVTASVTITYEVD